MCIYNGGADGQVGGGRVTIDWSGCLDDMAKVKFCGLWRRVPSSCHDSILS